ncbi:CdaR family transcriptional regulator [Conexibacter sp. SYSU D00693]|uniref:PucR family transcriptional regulator n=1 Tax=Conexibacter sp. SYSU D00693 TaxID=2812560 RepID=UPI00196B6C40|nr:helix-turn-helix domain-containing protein [Conexibacter sp. SYSU D00693]
MSPTAVGRAASDWHDRIRRQTAAELRPGLDGLVAECVAYVQQSMPELEVDEELAAGLYASAYDNLERIFSMLAQGTGVDQTVAPPGAIRYAEVMVQRGTPLATLLRAYRLGTMWFWTLWRREIIKRIEDPSLLMEAVDHSMSFVFDYVDIVSERVTDEYARQREHWARSAAALRWETVQEVLGDKAVDLDATAIRLGYDLRRTHLACVLWADLEHDDHDVMPLLEAQARALAARLGAGSVLLVPDGRSALWAWLGFEHEVPHDLLAAATAERHLLDGAHAACGVAAEGRAGFVSSHEEAVHARELLRLSGRGKDRLVAYADVVVASLLTADTPRARRFVDRELGPLAGDDDPTTRIRATVRVLLEESGRTASAARRLGIHQNTVAYRIRQAEQLLGHPLGDRRYELETALRMLDVLHR